ncbi:uncharacterized protein LOC129939461 [Eupeodes corollae]|uniref:uncharacterized protein LOC129939461 n=1 Tax=Eupeodes corollae TaxID=290404 RepID=UPI00249047EA|nr:uncharacterized protein LOC129939461 [Eupeodes corollae]
MFQFKWLRRFVRRNTNPIPESTAELWRRRLSIGYAVIAWQAFGLVCYSIYKGKNDWAKYHGLKSDEELAMSPAQQFSKTLNVEKGTILRFRGFTKVDEIPFDNRKDEEEI